MAKAKNLNGLDYDVYRVDKNSNEAKDRGPAYVGDELTYGKDKYKVVSIHAPEKNSENIESNPFVGMAVAPEVDGKFDYNNLILVGAGTNPQDPEALTDAGVAKVTGLSPEYQTANAYYNEVEKHKGWHVSQLTGYSQSAYMLNIGAQYHISTTIFNGWFNPDSLTKKQKEYIKAHPNMFVDYRHKDDSVVKWMDGNEDDGLGIDAWVAGSSHGLSSWKFDKQGRVLDSDGFPVLSKNQAKAAGKNYSQVVAPKLKSIRSALNSGNITGTQKIALSTELISYSAKGLRDKAEQNFSDAVTQIKKLSAEAESKETEIIKFVGNVGGPLMAPVAASIYLALAGQKKYRPERYTDAITKIEKVYDQQMKLAGQMDAMVKAIVESDASLTKLFI